MSIEKEKNRLKYALRPVGVYDINSNGLLNAELTAYAKGLDILSQNLAVLERECFVATAESFGLSLRELLLEKVFDEANTQKRRDILNYHNSVTANDFNRTGMEKAIKTAGINANIVELKDLSKLYINCLSMLDPNIDKEKAKKLAEPFLPAHLDYCFDFRSITWDNIDQRELSFDDMDAENLTWNEIDAYTD